MDVNININILIMKKDIKSVSDHYDESRDRWENSDHPKGESHLEYYRNKHPFYYSILEKANSTEENK